jgi:hypothetical protein
MIQEIYEKLKSFSEECKRRTKVESISQDVIMNDNLTQSVNFSNSIQKNEKKGKNLTKIYEIK